MAGHHQYSTSYSEKMRRLPSPPSRSRLLLNRTFFLSVGGVLTLLILLSHINPRVKESKWTIPDQVKEKWIAKLEDESRTSHSSIHTSGFSSDETTTTTSGTTIVVPSASSSDVAPPSNPTTNSSWPGFSNLRTLFVFGDSYSDTFFTPSMTPQPSDLHPMGNHGPDNHDTWVQATRWPAFLTTRYNDSVLHTYNFAKAGAMVSREIIKNTGSLGMAMVEQAEDLWRPRYVDYVYSDDDEDEDEGFAGRNNHRGNVTEEERGGKGRVWEANTSLFIVFIGINDNIRLHEKSWGGKPEMQPLILDVYREFVEKLYDAGGRNFLLIDLPPLNLYPIGSFHPALNLSVSSWNTAIHTFSSSFRASHSDTTMQLFSSHTFISNIMASPSAYTQTQGLKEVKQRCEAFGGEFDVAANEIERDSTREGCEWRLDEYLFFDPLHVTWRVHEALADQIARTLREFEG